MASFHGPMMWQDEAPTWARWVRTRDMTAQGFVDAIRLHVMEAAVPDTISVVQKPPGSRPSRDLIELSGWFNDLPEADHEMTKRVLALVARSHRPLA